jgi:predicted metal-binding membrane protein
MGLHHGAYCVACCWGLMVIGFVGGVMDLLWMGGATLLMTLEKLPQVGRYLTRPLGVGLISWGIFTLIQ